jgi:hypothetical protein
VLQAPPYAFRAGVRVAEPLLDAAHPAEQDHTDGEALGGERQHPAEHRALPLPAVEGDHQMNGGGRRRQAAEEIR